MIASPISGRISTPPAKRSAGASSSWWARVRSSALSQRPGNSTSSRVSTAPKDAIKASGKKIELSEVATGPTVNEEVTRVDSYYVGHKDVKGMFAVDAGSTMSVGKAMEKYGLAAKGVHAGGFDLLPQTLDAIAKDDLDFTIDQQPYLQGFYTVMEMAMFKFSGGLDGPGRDQHRPQVRRPRAMSSRTGRRRAGTKAIRQPKRSFARSGPITA